MSAEIQNICGTFISRKIHQPFGRFGPTAAIIQGPSSVQLVQGTQNDFLGYRERDQSSFQLVSSLGYGDWGGSFSLRWIFTGGVILHSTRFPTKSRDGRGHWDGIHHILSAAEHKHLARPPFPLHGHFQINSNTEGRILPACLTGNVVQWH